MSAIRPTSQSAGEAPKWKMQILRTSACLPPRRFVTRALPSCSRTLQLRNALGATSGRRRRQRQSANNAPSYLHRAPRSAASRDRVWHARTADDDVDDDSDSKGRARFRTQSPASQKRRCKHWRRPKLIGSRGANVCAALASRAISSGQPEAALEVSRAANPPSSPRKARA